MVPSAPNGRTPLNGPPTAPDSDDITAVRSIIELANRGQFEEALDYYAPEARIDLPSGVVRGSHLGREAIEEMLESAIKEYGRPRVRIVDLHEANDKVYAETLSVMTSPAGDGPESHDFHVFQFRDGKVVLHQVFTNTRVPSPEPPVE